MLQKIAGGVALALALTSVWNSTAIAQGEQYFSFGRYDIEGIRPNCAETETVVSPNAPDLIGAPDFSTITINGPVFDTLPPGIRLFLYYQTCASIMYYGRTAAELDTTAVRIGVREGWLAPADVESMCETDILVTAGWSAAPDAVRCESIYATMRAELQGPR